MSVILVACGMASSALALVDGQATTVRTARPGILTLRTGDVALDNCVNELGGATFSSRWMLLRIEGGRDGMNAPRRAALIDAGLVPVGYLPFDCYIVDTSRAADAPGSAPAAARALGFILGAYAIDQSWRIDNSLRQLNGNEEVQTNVWLFTNADSAGASALIATLPGVRLLETERVGYTVRLALRGPAQALPAIAAHEDVYYIEPLPTYAVRSNVTTRWTIQSGTLNVTPLYTNGLDGAGQIIGIIDGGLATNHCSFRDTVNPIGPLHRKIAAYNSPNFYDFHGTHVAGTAAGDAVGFDFSSNQRGVAYNARIVFSLHPQATFTSVYGKHFTHYSQGALTQSNSWGTDSTREYDGGCRAIDTLLFQNDDIFLAHAASNGQLVTNPENAKNSLCVTSSMNGLNANSYCGGGTGPTLDGRRKPEVSAPGCAITSATGSSGCSTGTISGTSMATPAVGGMGALVRQYYVAGFYPGGSANAGNALSPSGALVKATIVNSALDMTAVPGYPSDREGWGRIVADEALYFAGDQRNLIVRDVRNTQGLNTQDEQLLTFTVTNSALPLRITMAYYDAPAEVNAASTPVNNLNLTVSSPQGITYLGNVFLGGQSTTGGVADQMNNLEQVHLSAPAPGEWTVRIAAPAVPLGPQGFAVVISGDVEPIAACIGDFNKNGGIDGADIEDFFLSWTQSDPRADVNGDGGIDGTDVEVFFVAWQAGC